MRLLIRFETARWTIPALFALALALRLALIVFLPQMPSSDSAWYVIRATEIAQGMGYQEAGHPTAFWPVGYPALLAASMTIFGTATLLGPMLLNLIAAAAILGLILWFSRALGNGELAARFAALVYALYPAHIAYTGVASSETTSTAVSMAAFALLVSGRRRWLMLILAGLVFGAATLMRAQMMLFPIGAIVAIALAFRDVTWRDAAKATLLVHLALAAVVLPWSLRNEAQLGTFVPVSTNGGMSLYTGANDGATGDWFAWEHGPLWDRVGIPFAQRVERQVELDARFKALSIDWIRAHPAEWTALGVKKMVLLWRKDSDAFWSLHDTYPAQDRVWTALQALDQLYYLAILALALWPIGRGVRGIWRRDDNAPLALLACMPVFATLLAFGFTGQIRYHYPAMPFLIVAAGVTLAALAQRRRGQPAVDSTLATA